MRPPPPVTNASIVLETPEQIVPGPKGLSIRLSAGQIFIKEPGMGTPCLIQNQRNDETMTWTCAYEGGNLDDILVPAQDGYGLKWMESIAESVDAWLGHHWRIAEAKLPPGGAA